jgi:hypothetical protein
VEVILLAQPLPILKPFAVIPAAAAEFVGAIAVSNQCAIAADEECLAGVGWLAANAGGFAGAKYLEARGGLPFASAMWGGDVPAYAIETGMKIMGH